MMDLLVRSDERATCRQETETGSIQVGSAELGKIALAGTGG
jgi:hypothetical protein